MLVRIVHFLLGAGLAGSGGWLAWTNRAGAANIFPPGPDGMPWLFIAGLIGLAAGVVFLVSAVHPRPNRRARMIAESEVREAKLGAAESYYSERSRAADRDWRSDDIPPPVTPAPARVQEPAWTAPAPPPPPPPAPTPPAPQVAKPVATSLPPEAPAAAPFPATATLAPIPAASEPPPAPAPVAQKAVAPAAPAPVVAAPVVAAPVAAAPVTPAPVAPPPVAAPAPVAPPPVAPAPPPAPAAASADPFAAIRTALATGHLDDAEKLLNTERETAQGQALAVLTGLAGDHAAAAGRASNAKWLWRLALKRFGELGAMDTPAAKAVAESLRVAG